ncbi:DUF5658 family protein [Robertmurraya kyonggiensis]|uniref:DUF5658 family protein n=1 Tax=Robertmurraya kyonggiensis TaxID=1037680 RepID=UPI0026C9E384
MRIGPALFVYLAILNFFDGGMTFIGIYFDMIEEFNPLMAVVISKNPWSFLLMKCFLSVFLLLVFYFIKGQTISNFLKTLMLCSVILYTSVSILHVTWLFLN